MSAVNAGRIVGVAITAALVMYLVPVLLFGSEASPVAIAVVAAVVAAAEYRRLQARPALPDSFWIVLALAALLLYAGALLGGPVPTARGDWLAMVVVFGFPVLLLVQIFMRRLRRGRGPDRR